MFQPAEESGNEDYAKQERRQQQQVSTSVKSRKTYLKHPYMYSMVYIHTYSSLADLAAAKTSLLQQRAASVKKGTDLTPPPDSEFAWNI